MPTKRTDFQELAAKLYADGLSDLRIAEQCGTAVSTIARWRKQQNLPPSQPHKKSKRQKSSDECDERALKSYTDVPEQAEAAVVIARNVKPNPNQPLTVSQLSELLGEIALDAPDALVMSADGEYIASVRYSVVMAPGGIVEAWCTLFVPE